MLTTDVDRSDLAAGDGDEDIPPKATHPAAADTAGKGNLYRTDASGHPPTGCLDLGVAVGLVT